MTTPPTPSQIEDADRLMRKVFVGYQTADVERVAAFLAARDAEKDREMAGLRTGWSAAQGAAASWRLRAEKSEELEEREAGLRKELAEVRAYVSRANDSLGIPSDNSFRLVGKIDELKFRADTLEKELVAAKLEALVPWRDRAEKAEAHLLHVEKMLNGRIIELESDLAAVTKERDGQRDKANRSWNNWEQTKNKLLALESELAAERKAIKDCGWEDALKAREELSALRSPVADEEVRAALAYFAEKPDCTKYVTLNHHIEVLARALRAKTAENAALKSQLKSTVEKIYTSEDFADAVSLAKPGRLLPLDDDGNLSAQGVTVLVHAVCTLKSRLDAANKEITDWSQK